MPRLEDLPAHKECRSCGEVKPKLDFSVRKRTLKSGRLAFYLEGQCRKCATERTSKYYHEVYKHRLHERPHEKRGELLVDGKPVLDWLATHDVPGYVDDSVRKRFNDLREGRAKLISIDTVDRFLVQIRCTELLNEWYPIDTK